MRILLLASLLLLAPACLHRRRVVFEHDTLTGRDTMTYCGRPITIQELFALGERADSKRIDLIVKKDGKIEKWNFKEWFDGMNQLPHAILSMPGDFVD